MLGVVGSDLTSFKLEPTTPNLTQPIAAKTRWPNAHNILRSTMLRYVALTCGDLLAGALELSQEKIFSLVVCMRWVQGLSRVIVYGHTEFVDNKDVITC